MAAPATSGNGTTRAALAHDHEWRKKEFAVLLATKVEQGYDVESQGDTEAVIATPGRRRRFRSQILGKRQRISIDNEGLRTTRGIDSRDTR
jgi:hypothetical protein